MITDSQIVDTCVRDEQRPADVAAASYGADVVKMIADPLLHGAPLRIQARIAFRFAARVLALEPSDRAVAQTILAQLGGRRFVLMTGAKNLLGAASSLSFRLPANFASDGINYVRVTLNGLDTYDVEFLRLHGVKSAVKAYEAGIYAEDLRRVFTRVTGLDTSL